MGRPRGTLADEVRGAKLGDHRLNRRLVKLIERVSEEPNASFPSLLDDAELEGAYRFLGNERVNVDAILAPHVEATVRRVQEEDVVLALHDTTTMSFRAEGSREGIDRLYEKGKQQFFSHHTLAVSGDGSRRVLGHLALSIHTQQADTHGRWAGHVLTVDALGISKKVVHVMDREADDYALFATCIEKGRRFVIRMQHDRLLRPTEADGARAVTDLLARTPLVAERDVVLSRRLSAGRGPKDRKVHPARDGRAAKLAIYAAEVPLRRPKNANTDLPRSLSVNVVEVREVDVPAGEAPVHWLLVTTEPIETVEQILTVVDWYRARWVIEEFFKALKTGCAFEKRQLHDLHALSNALGLFIPVAWQLLVLRADARARPTAPAAAVLSTDQLHVLRRVARKPLPKQPTARDVYLAIAALGGHLKHNGEPGWQVLGRGYEKLLTLTEGYNLARAAAPPQDAHNPKVCGTDQS
jgi:hypothetical protein